MSIKHLCLFSVAMFIKLSCSSSKQYVENEYVERTGYEVVELPFISKGDTTSINELRIYSIRSALDATRIMYENFGEWNQSMPGKYQDNIEQRQWNNFQLEPIGETYMVFTDGTETRTEYFTSVIVLGDDKSDGLSYDSPKRDAIIDWFIEKNSTLSYNNSIYKKLK